MANKMMLSSSDQTKGFLMKNRKKHKAQGGLQKQRPRQTSKYSIFGKY